MAPKDLPCYEGEPVIITDKEGYISANPACGRHDTRVLLLRTNRTYRIKLLDFSPASFSEGADCVEYAVITEAAIGSKKRICRTGRYKRTVYTSYTGNVFIFINNAPGLSRNGERPMFLLHYEGIHYGDDN